MQDGNLWNFKIKNNFHVKKNQYAFLHKGFSYNNQGVWQRNAYAYEGISFDSCGGHPDPSSSYHK